MVKFIKSRITIKPCAELDFHKPEEPDSRRTVGLLAKCCNIKPRCRKLGYSEMQEAVACLHTATPSLLAEQGRREARLHICSPLLPCFPCSASFLSSSVRWASASSSLCSLQGSLRYSLPGRRGSWCDTPGTRAGCPASANLPQSPGCWVTWDRYSKLRQKYKH